MAIFNNRGLLCQKETTPFGVVVKVLGPERPEQATVPLDKADLLSPRMFYPNSKTPKIPGSLWDEVILLFRHYCVARSAAVDVPNVTNPELGWIKDLLVEDIVDSNEVAVSFAYSADKDDYKAVVSTQKVSGASVQGDRRVCMDIVDRTVCPFPPPGYEEIGSSHSHNTMSSFYSGTDDINEVAKPGYHIVVGSITKDSYTAVASLMHKGIRYYTTLDKIVDMSTSLQEVVEIGVCRKVKGLDLVEKAVHENQWVKSISLGNLNDKTRVKVEVNSLSEKALAEPDDFGNFISVEKDSFVKFMRSKRELPQEKSGGFCISTPDMVDVGEKIRNMVEVINKLDLESAQEMVDLVGAEWIILGGQQEIVEYLKYCGVEKREEPLDCSELDVMLSLIPQEDYGLLEAYITFLQKENKDPFVCQCLSYHLESGVDSEAHLRYDHRVVDYVKSNSQSVTVWCEDELHPTAKEGAVWWEIEDEELDEEEAEMVWSEDFLQPTYVEERDYTYLLAGLKSRLSEIYESASTTQDREAACLMVIAALIDTKLLPRDSKLVSSLPEEDFKKAYDNYLNSIFS